MNPFSILEEQRPTNTFTWTYDSKTLIAHNISNEKKRKEVKNWSWQIEIGVKQEKRSLPGPAVRHESMQVDRQQPSNPALKKRSQKEQKEVYERLSLLLSTHIGLSPAAPGSALGYCLLGTFSTYGSQRHPHSIIDRNNQAQKGWKQEIERLRWEPRDLLWVLFPSSILSFIHTKD